MTDTALIGSSCALGVFWSSKRYFDYLIDETNLSLLRGKEFEMCIRDRAGSGSQATACHRA